MLRIHYVVNHLLHFMYIKFSNMLYVLQSVATLKKSEVPTLLRIHYVVNRNLLHFMYIKFSNMLYVLQSVATLKI